MPIINSIINWLNVNRLNQIEQFKKYPVETQQETLDQLLVKAASTEWGKKYNYASITSVKEYQSRFNVQTYAKEKLICYGRVKSNGSLNLQEPHPQNPNSFQ